MKRLLCFVRTYAKAIGAAGGAVVSLIAAHVAGLPAGWAVAAPAAITTALVYLIPNTDCPPA